jgi:3-oxoacyl-[acyl-carrier protein] reductase
MNLQLKNKTALVVAASSGIGKASAEELIKEGCNVAICSSSKDNLLAAVEDIKVKFGAEPIWSVCDINDKNNIEETVKYVNKKFGGIDILVNNCGGPITGFFENLTEKNWEHAYEQVLMSAIRFTRLVLPAMKEKKWGRIINITSLSVKQPIDNLILSNSLRSAVTAFSKTLSSQIGKYNITINNVAPGYTLTPRIIELAKSRAELAQTTPDKILESMAEEVPMKRLAKPEEVASLVLYLSSEQAGYINGQTIVVDGGVVKSTY